MSAIKNKLFFLLNLMILLDYLNSYSLAQNKQNSIIKLFCINSVKEEMLKSEISYSEKIANETCDCYYEEFIQSGSHQAAKSKCKLKAHDKFKS